MNANEENKFDMLSKSSALVSLKVADSFRKFINTQQERKIYDCILSNSTDTKYLNLLTYGYWNSQEEWSQLTRVLKDANGQYCHNLLRVLTLFFIPCVLVSLLQIKVTYTCSYIQCWWFLLQENYMIFQVSIGEYFYNNLYKEKKRKS